MVHVISDLHIADKTVSSHRGYTTTVEHDAQLAENWDKTVKPKDTVYVLGDISTGGRESLLTASIWLSKRPGRKILVAGNHDRCHPMYRDAHNWQDLYLIPFLSVQLAARRKIKLADGSPQDILFSHFPYQGDHVTPDRHTQWRLPNHGLPIVHGHTHSTVKWSLAKYANGHALQINACPEANDMTPVNLETIYQKVREHVTLVPPVRQHETDR